MDEAIIIFSPKPKLTLLTEKAQLRNLNAPSLTKIPYATERNWMYFSETEAAEIGQYHWTWDEQPAKSSTIVGRDH